MRIRPDSKGFSLVEVLLGVTILAVIAVPLARTFITSAKTSVKAQNLRSETIAAQNILEAYAAADIAAVIEGLTKNERSFAAGTIEKLEIYEGEDGWVTVSEEALSKIDTQGPGYRITLSGIPVDLKTYDAVLSVVANDKYLKLNEKEIVHFKPMSAVYNQPSPTKPDPLEGQNYSPDIMAASHIALQAQIDLLEILLAEEGEEGSQAALPEIQLTYLDFLEIMRRTVAINIRQLSSAKGVISCSALFSYEASYNGNSYTYETVNEVYCDNLAAGSDYGLYFFYYPNLNKAPDSDIINIYNKDNLEMNVYLIRQNYGDLSKNRPLIKLWETHTEWSDKAAASVYPNFVSSYRFYLNDAQYKTIQRKTGTLGGLASENRIYEVTAELYEQGGGYKEPLFKMDASSVE